jgi:hypothetical protein
MDGNGLFFTKYFKFPTANEVPFFPNIYSLYSNMKVSWSGESVLIDIAVISKTNTEQMVKKRIICQSRLSLQ